MNRIEYIRYSHRRANSRVRAWIGSVRMRLARRSRLLGWLWMVPASIFYALVVLFSWLTFCVVLFRDPRFTLHYLESEIECRGLTGAEARRYLDKQHRDYERRLAYGNFTRDEQRRINQTFAYLYNRYPAPARDDLNARLDEVQSAVAEIAGFTRQRQEELEQARERETALQVQAEKRRAINRSRTGFDPTPEDFSPRLTDRQLDLLTEHINRIGLFRRDVTRPEVELLLACQLPEPLQTTHNKLLALLLESLSAARFITPKWQRVAGAKGCFLSKLGKPLTAERETALQVQAEKRRAINRSRTGFDPTPEDFSPRLTDRQLDLLTEHINRIGLFRRDVTRPEVELLLSPASPGAATDDTQQAAGAAARIAERRALHHPEVAARGRSQGVLPLEAGQAAYSQGSLGGQADGRHHRRETRATDSRLHPGPGGRAVIACP